MAFSISFVQSSHLNVEIGSSELLAEIVINDFSEYMAVPIKFWPKREYERQWASAINDLSRSESSKSALVVAVLDPRDEVSAVCWPMYRDKTVVYIQNKLILSDQIKGPFDISKIKEYIGVREVSSEDGSLISEWKISYKDLSLWSVDQ